MLILKGLGRKTMKDKTKNILELHLTFLLLGLAAIFVKGIAFPAFFINFARSVIAASVLGVVLIFVKKQKLLVNNWRDLVVLCLIGVFMATHWLTAVFSLQLSTVAITSLAMGMIPIFSTFIEPIFFKEKISLSDILLAMIALGGLFLMIPEFSFANNLTLGAIFGVFSALAFSIRSVLCKKYIKKYSASLIMFYQLCVTALITFPFIFWVEFSINNVFSWINLILLAILATVVGQTLMIRSFKHFKVATVSIQASLITLYAILFAMFFLQEIPHPKTIIGGMVIISVAAIETWRHRKR
jgi:drug/metabolite transporter (DMT)-like permease